MLSNEETLRQKLQILRKLEALEKKGIQLTKKYNMDSPLAILMVTGFVTLEMSYNTLIGKWKGLRKKNN